ncbi:hypothetical protein niasHS_013417 [Heterodera schachtii]|uniref:Globin domain-containing protein n=1 Tax=Heterodera schachtii TaxID=97005 RepID=A0ABD2I3W3_HETSC
MHPSVTEKHSLNGFINNNHNNNNNNNLSPTNLVFCQTDGPQSRSNNHLLTAPENSHQLLRRSRSASPITSMQRLKLQQQYHLGVLLSHDQQMLIRKSWLKIPKAAFGKAVFEHMIGACPAVVRLFDPPADASTIVRHQRYFTELVQRVVDAFLRPTLEQCSESERPLAQWLELIGQRHAQFKVKRAHWDCLGEALTDAVCHWLPPGRQRRETVHAWRVMLSFISDRLGTQTPSAGHHGPTACQMHHPRIELLQLIADGTGGGGSSHQE